MIMKTKLVKSITSYLLFACALVSLVAAMVLGTSATAGAAADGQACSVHMLKGLYLWTFDGYENFGGNFVPKAIMQGLQFNGDGTTFNPFGTVNIGGTIIIDATGGVGTYTGNRTARAPCQSPTAQALISTSDRVHRRFGSPRLQEVLAAAQD